MRPIWTGAIGFGLVNIPVKLYSATQRSEINLDMLDKDDHSRIKYKRVNEKSGKEVTWEQINESNFAYLPKPEDCHNGMEPPTKPGPNGSYPVYSPGKSILI